MTMFIAYLRRDARGSVAIETAIVAPVLVLLALGTFDVSQMVSRQDDLQSAAAEAEAIVQASPPKDSAARDTVRAHDTTVLGLAWEIEPASASLEVASAVLFATRDLLGLVRLHGGGPEQRLQDGRGVGPVLGELALSGYTGPIVLCPSSRDARTLDLWARWAESRGSSGCGHAASTREHALDMRDVEPRDRLDTILGAYGTLVPGATLHLTLDHDPTCMYYTLEATEPPRSFEFHVVENGPEVWRAEVTRL